MADTKTSGGTRIYRHLQEGLERTHARTHSHTVAFKVFVVNLSICQVTCGRKKVFVSYDKSIRSRYSPDCELSNCKRRQMNVVQTLFVCPWCGLFAGYVM